MASREKKTDFASKGYKHREHRSKKGRVSDYKHRRKWRTILREVQEWGERKKRKFKKINDIS